VFYTVKPSQATLAEVALTCNICCQKFSRCSHFTDHLQRRKTRVNLSMISAFFSPAACMSYCQYWRQLYSKLINSHHLPCLIIYEDSEITACPCASPPPFAPLEHVPALWCLVRQDSSSCKTVSNFIYCSIWQQSAIPALSEQSPSKLAVITAGVFCRCC